MGWFFTQGQTKAELITHLTEGDTTLRTHRKCLRGNTLWAIQENVGHPELGRFIVAYLLRKQPGYGWGYKPVEESMGPAELSCPVSYLDEVPVPDSQFAPEWRNRVRQRHAEKNRQRRMAQQAQVGNQVEMIAGVEPRMLKIVRTRPLTGRASDGSLWRVPPKFIERVA